MGAQLSSALTALTGFFSRSFWLGSFMPVSLFFGLHVLLHVWTFGDVAFLDDLLNQETLAAGVTIVIGLVVLSFALLPAQPYLLWVLDGSLLPEFLHDWLRGVRVRRLRRRLVERDRAEAELHLWHGLAERAGAAIAAAEQKLSADPYGYGTAWPISDKLLDRADVELSRLEAALERSLDRQDDLPDIGLARRATGAVISTLVESEDPENRMARLRQGITSAFVEVGLGFAVTGQAAKDDLPWAFFTCSDFDPARLSAAGLSAAAMLDLPHRRDSEAHKDKLRTKLREAFEAAGMADAIANVEEIDRLAQLYLTGSDAVQRQTALRDRLLAALDKAEKEGEYRLGILQGRFRNIAVSDPQGTRIGDARWLAESYSKRVYGIDFDYLWPRLQILLAKTDELASLNEARSNVDFASLCLGLTITLLPWPFILASVGQDWKLFAVLSTAIPLAMLGLYWLVVASYGVFGNVLQATIDRHRLAVLEMLHQQRPASLTEEREAWAGLIKATHHGGSVPISDTKAEQR